MQRFNNILLFGGETRNENMPVGFYSSLALLPMRGKPVIWWQLNNLKKYGIDKFIIAVCSNNLKLIDYIKNILCENFDIELVLVNSRKNILSSLKYSLPYQALVFSLSSVISQTLLIPCRLSEYAFTIDSAIRIFSDDILPAI